VLQKYAVPTGAQSPAYRARTQLLPLLQQWANGYLVSAELSGSYAKGTAVSLGTDADIFISVRHDTPETLSEIYWTLYRFIQNRGYAPRTQRVSLRINHAGLDIDLVPAKRQRGASLDHSLYSSRSHSWTQTNVRQHIALISGSSRTREMKAIKIWRDLHGLDFPSFYLELAVLRALRGYPIWGDVALKVRVTLEFIASSLDTIRIVDPANSNNVISDDLTLSEKQVVIAQARNSLAQQTWGNVLW